MAREKRAVSPVTAPAFFASAAKSPSFASAASCLARSRATVSAFWCFTAAATLSRISASGGTPAGMTAVVLRITSPTGVDTGADTPPTVSANAASSSGSGAARAAVRSRRAMVVSTARNPSFWASALKSAAAWSGGRICSAFALAAPSPARVFQIAMFVL